MGSLSEVSFQLFFQNQKPTENRPQILKKQPKGRTLRQALRRIFRQSRQIVSKQLKNVQLYAAVGVKVLLFGIELIGKGLVDVEVFSRVDDHDTAQKVHGV